MQLAGHYYNTQTMLCTYNEVGGHFQTLTPQAAGLAGNTLLLQVF
jgi:hypothetical protein